jgi:hypothetical protein
MTEQEARKWPDLMRIVEDRVKPDRITKDANKYPRMVHEWWKFWNSRPELETAVQALDRVLIIARVSQTCAFTFLPTGTVFSEQLIVIANDSYSFLCLLQSRVHECWARFLGSSMKDDLRYTPTDCFETFPFPDSMATNAELGAVGKEYYEFRAALMVKNNEGLTKIYNRFHDPNETSPDIKRLRELHAGMDRAVFNAYGWKDLKPTCEFLLDYEEEEDEEEASGRRQKKKPWRYRWPDEFRDTVLARLLELNKQRTEQERLAGLSAAAKETGKAKRGKAKKSPSSQDDNPTLFQKYAAGGDK